MKNEIEVKPLTAERIDHFFLYLNDHISDNGKDGSSLFLPISRNDLHIPKGLISSFRDGLSIPIGQLGWRRVLIAENLKGEIVGHIDLRSHNEDYTHHRAVLGMGVHRDCRRSGLGRLLIESIEAWAKNKTTIEQIDLRVLSQNRVATRLYKKMGFLKNGEIEDMFRIDGASLTYILMAKKITKVNAFAHSQ